MEKAKRNPMIYTSKKWLQWLCDSPSYYVLQLDQGSLLSPEFSLVLSGYPFFLLLYIVYVWSMYLHFTDL